MSILHLINGGIDIPLFYFKMKLFLKLKLGGKKNNG
jgi:hypothetical protein